MSPLIMLLLLLLLPMSAYCFCFTTPTTTPCSFSRRHINNKGLLVRRAPNDDDSPHSIAELKILLVDHYDSYTYNLYNMLLQQQSCQVTVITKDFDGVLPNDMDGIVLSPGPGRPGNNTDLGRTLEIIKHYSSDDSIPILGVCLGHQALGYAHGASIVECETPVHGQVHSIELHNSGGDLWKGILNGTTATLNDDATTHTMNVTRYHSLKVQDLNGTDLIATATYHDDETHETVIMGLQHKTKPLYGVQFHPESIGTPQGYVIVDNFLNVCQEQRQRQRQRNSDAEEPHRIIEQQRQRQRATHYDASSLEDPQQSSSSPPLHGEQQDKTPLFVSTTTLNNVDATPTQVFERLYSKHSHAIWLDSSSASSASSVSSSQARYSIMGAMTGPLSKRIEYYGVEHEQQQQQQRGVYVTTNKDGAPSEDDEQEDILDYLQRQQERYPLIYNDDDVVAKSLPFVGGHLGYLGYEVRHDTQRKLDGTAQQDDASISTTVNPNVPTAAFLFCDQTILYDHQTNQWHLVELTEHAPTTSATSSDDDDANGGDDSNNAAAVNSDTTNGSAAPNGDAANGITNGSAAVNGDANGITNGSTNGITNGSAAVNGAANGVTNGAAVNGSTNGITNGSAAAGNAYGDTNGSTAVNGDANGAAVNGSTNGITNGSTAVNGDANGVTKASTAVNGNANGATNGSANNVASNGAIANGSAASDWRRHTEQVLRQLTHDDEPQHHDTHHTRKQQQQQQQQQLSFVPNRSRQTYQADIDNCHTQIKRGESYELCLTNQLETTVDNNNNREPWGLYKILRDCNPAPFAAFVNWQGGKGDDASRNAKLAICCSSPERFVSIQPNDNDDDDDEMIVEAKPIKGTAARPLNNNNMNAVLDQEIAHALQHDVKNRAENLMIVDLLRNDLHRVCKNVHVPKLMAIESYATVHQLVSTIRGTLDDSNGPVDVLTACFPGGSMTGAPKRRTMELLHDMEQEVCRGPYSGCLGYIGLDGRMDMNIVIRSAVLTPKEDDDSWKVSIGAGGAITALSESDDEYEEMLLKARAIQKAVELWATSKDDETYNGVVSQSSNGISASPLVNNRKGGDLPRTNGRTATPVRANGSRRKSTNANV